MLNSYRLIHLLVHILQLALMVSSKLIPETNLCQICDCASPNSLNSTRARHECYKYGAYDVFCHPKYHGSRNTVHECESFFSIYPPKDSTKQCNVNIFNNHGEIQDIITLAPNGSVSSTNNSWHTISRNNPNSLYYGIAKRVKSQKHFEEFEEGRYSFEFSDNITIDQFLYSRIIFNARGLHTYSNVLKNDTDGAYIQDLDRQESFVNVGHKFQECINYYSSNVTIKNIGKYPMEKYIKCIVLNGKSTTCKWKWLAQENKFKIFVNRSSFIQTKICEYRKFGIEDGSIFAIMRCSMRIQYFNGDNKFDLPFISKSSLIQVSQFFVPEEMAKDIGIVLTLVALSLFLLLVLVWTYRRRITDILNEMKKIARYVVNQRQI